MLVIVIHVYVLVISISTLNNSILFQLKKKIFIHSTQPQIEQC